MKSQAAYLQERCAGPWTAARRRPTPLHLRQRRGFPGPGNLPLGGGLAGRNTLRLSDISEETVTSATWVEDFQQGQPDGGRADTSSSRQQQQQNPAASATEMFQAALSTMDFVPGPVASTSSMDSLDDLDGPLSSTDTAPEDICVEQQHQVAARDGRAVYEVLRIDQAGKTRKVYVRRRDLLRAHGLQPRDLRRIDPSLSPTKTSPSVTIKDTTLLVNLGGVRAIIAADKCLLFEPQSTSSRKFLDLTIPRLQASAGAKMMRQLRDRYPQATLPEAGFEEPTAPPFELEVLEGALMVATGRLDNELLGATRKVGSMLQKLPRDINPVNLEELRRVKQLLVELESKADNLRSMLEELMDDEDDLRDMNLTTRPAREEKRRQRERERLKQEVEREWAERGERRSPSSEASTAADGSSIMPGSGGGATSASATAAAATIAAAAAAAPAAQQPLASSSRGSAAPAPAPTAPTSTAAAPPAAPAVAPFLAGATSRSGSPASTTSSSGSGSEGSRGRASLAASDDADSLQPLLQEQQQQEQEQQQEQQQEQAQAQQQWEQKQQQRERERERVMDRDEFIDDAEERLEELAEEEEEERELEEVEDLLEYYLQRAATTQSEAERLLAGARDLEESIGLSLSARRFEVNRLELTLSICSFAAAVGAMIAGLFGMNMRNTMEMSVVGFWGISAGIVLLCYFIFVALYRYTKQRRIL